MIVVYMYLVSVQKWLWPVSNWFSLAKTSLELRFNWHFLWIGLYLVMAKKGTDIGVGVQNGIKSVFERKVQLMLALQEGAGSGSGGLRLRTLSVTTRSLCATQATHGDMP